MKRASWITAIWIPPIPTAGSVTPHKHKFVAPRMDRPQLKTVSLPIGDPGPNAVSKGKGKCKPFSGHCPFCGRWCRSLADDPAGNNDVHKGMEKGRWSQWHAKSQGKPDDVHTKRFRRRRDRKVESVRLGKGAVRSVAEKSVHFRMVERNLCSCLIKIRVQSIPLQLQCFIRMPLLRSKTSCHGPHHHNVTSQALDPFSSEIDCHLDQTRILATILLH